MAKESIFKGVSPSVRNKENPWRAQIYTGGVTYHLGNFKSEKEAAEAYDNAAHHLNLFCRSRYATLNYPGVYQAETPPPPSIRTLEIIADYEKRIGRKQGNAFAPTPPATLRAAQELLTSLCASRAMLDQQIVTQKAIIQTLTPGVTKLPDPWKKDEEAKRKQELEALGLQPMKYEGKDNEPVATISNTEEEYVCPECGFQAELDGVFTRCCRVQVTDK